VARQRTGHGRQALDPLRERIRQARPPSSAVPPAAPPPSIEEVVPPPGAGAGGVENIPEELLPADKQVEDELNHAGLDITVPGEDRADAEDEHSDVPPS
jgi:hypothetical protein